MCNDFTNKFKCSLNKDIAIYNPVQQKVVQTSTILFEQRKTNPYFLCIGRLEHQKNFADAISAFAQLIHNNPENIYQKLQLKVVGIGSLLKDLKQLTKKEKVIEKVQFLAYQDPGPLFKNALATVLTSHYEGFPNVMLESLACDTPVVAYDFDYGPRETIINTVNGFLVPQYNLQSLVYNFKQVLNVEFSPQQIQQSVIKHHSE